jgi:uncharacterized membrane protein
VQHPGAGKIAMGRTSSHNLFDVIFGTLLLSDCKNLHVSVGSGNSALITAMQSDQVVGCLAAMVDMSLLTLLCFFFEDTRGPLFLSVLN